MHNNSAGKTLTIFMVLIMILLVCSTSIGFFLYHQEAQLYKQAQNDLENSHAAELKLQADLKEARHQLAVALDKNKEADEKINSLMDEMELNEGLRKELKSENVSLKEALEAAKKEKEKMKAGLEEARKKYSQVQELFKAEQDKSGSLQNSIKELEQAKAGAEAKIEAMQSDLKAYHQRTPDRQIASEDVAAGQGNSGKSKVELDKIVVNPGGTDRGRVLSVDKEAEFIVCDLGLRKGVKTGDIFSVYRGDEYLGDVRVSRVQQELSAADIIPPFSSRKVRKNDSVVFKP